MNRIRTVTIALVTLTVLFSWENGQSQTNSPCATDLDSCLPRGCAAQDTPDALVNQSKRRVTLSETPVRLTLDDFERLQSQADQLVGQNVSLDQTARNRLQNLKLKSSDKLVSEGDLVEVVGYVIGLPTRPKASGPESVNCRLTGTENNDFHIPFARHPEDTEFEGIVVEMIPQGRPTRWATGKLKKVAREGRPVTVRGQLFYDNKHLVNDDPDDVKTGQPKRFSLWEVHPVTEFHVCMRADKKCDSKQVKEPQWKPLEKLAD